MGRQLRHPHDETVWGNCPATCERHKIYHYEDGAWIGMEEIQEPMLRNMELVFVRPRSWHHILMESDVQRDRDSVFRAFLLVGIDLNPQPACDCEFAVKHWAASASNVVRNVLSRRTSGIKCEVLIGSFGALRLSHMLW